MVDLKWQRDTIKFVIRLPYDSKQPISSLKIILKTHILILDFTKSPPKPVLYQGQSFWMTISTIPSSTSYWKKRWTTVASCQWGHSANYSSMHFLEERWKHTERLRGSPKLGGFPKMKWAGSTLIFTTGRTTVSIQINSFQKRYMFYYCYCTGEQHSPSA